mmetsp:Transcript_42744/g.79233  ORF Transcript_42744/g.79233 Transcript_42744/m.79233 type:complete len:223 (-) Transcript_42744:251-919(-)
MLVILWGLNWVFLCAIWASRRRPSCTGITSGARRVDQGGSCCSCFFVCPRRGAGCSPFSRSPPVPQLPHPPLLPLPSLPLPRLLCRRCALAGCGGCRTAGGCSPTEGAAHALQRRVAGPLPCCPPLRTLPETHRRCGGCCVSLSLRCAYHSRTPRRRRRHRYRKLRDWGRRRDLKRSCGTPPTKRSCGLRRGLRPRICWAHSWRGTAARRPQSRASQGWPRP